MRWPVLCLAVSILIVVAPEPTDTAAVQSFQRGTALATGSEPGQYSGKGGRAPEQAFQRAIARRPHDPQPWRGLGTLYLSQGRAQEAHHAFNQAILRGDDGCALDRDLAQLYAELGDLRRSIHQWDDYLARCPDDRAARLTLAQTAIHLADWERANAELTHLLANDPTDAPAHAWLGLLLIGPDPAAGRLHLQRATEQDPNMAALLKPIIDAERQSLASDDPAYRSALLGVALLNLDVEEKLAPVTTTLALRSLLAATYLNPIYADAYAYLGQALDRLGWSGWALTALQYALRLAPQSPVVLTLTGLYWDRHGDPALARQYYELAYEHDPDNAALYLEIAATYAAEGQYTAAETWLLLATQASPDDPQVWEALARFYVDNGIGIKESGLAVVTQLLDLAPDDARAHDLAGWAYFLSEMDDQAESNLNQALILDPTLASAHYHLGRLYARQGRYADAAQAYLRADDYGLQGQLEAELERAWNRLPETYRGQP